MNEPGLFRLLSLNSFIVKELKLVELNSVLLKYWTSGSMSLKYPSESMTSSICISVGLIGPGLIDAPVSPHKNNKINISIQLLGLLTIDVLLVEENLVLDKNLLK